MKIKSFLMVSGILMLSALFASIVSCEGSGGGSGTVPVVSPSNPEDGATDISTFSAISANVSCNGSVSDASTLTTSTFKVEDDEGNAVAGTVALDDTLTTAIFTPTEPLEGSTTYTVTFTTGFVCPGGGSLAQDSRWTFTTAAFPAVAATSGTTCATKGDGALYCWGFNNNGEVGDGTTTERHVPTKSGSAKDWAKLSGGASGTHFCGIKAGGGLWCWGRNADGQLGIGSTVNKSSPMMAGRDVDWESVAAGGSHTCAVKKGGALYCWGLNDNGQLGIGSNVGKTSPTQVGTDTDWASVTAGGTHTCAVKTGGAAFCWGSNSTGQLGDNTNDDRSSPTRVVSDQVWASVAAGGVHTCALTVAGASYCWGFNNNGQLGDGSIQSKNVPTGVTNVPSFERCRRLFGGLMHTCAESIDGSIWCWGLNGNGQVGDGTTENRAAPAKVSMDPTAGAFVAAGGMHTCARGATGALYCWGWNESGQLGDGTAVDSKAPKQIEGF